MTGKGEIAGNIIMQLKGIKDHRRDWGNKRHELVDILFIALCAIVCGLQDFEGMVIFAQERLEWLRKYVELRNGIPSVSTFERIFQAMSPGAMRKFYQSWTDNMRTQATKLVEKRASGTHKTDYEYDRDNRSTKIQYNDAQHKVEYGYDVLDRVSSRKVTNGANAYTSTYAYAAGAASYGSNATSILLSGIAQSGMNFTYAYDARSNVTSETRNGTAVSYGYNGLGQLIRVNNSHDATSGAAGTTWVYAYDRGGNVLSKTRYAYTTGTVGTALHTVSYVYGDSNWKDKLTSYNGNTITYDAIGNPLSDGTWTYTWQGGRQLKTMSKSGESLEFVYDHNGNRVQKKRTASSTTETTNYILHGQLLTGLTKGNDNMHFFYDADARPAMVNFNGVTYTYVFNGLGDVVGLVDANGNCVVEYKYDAWGKPLSTTATATYTTLAALNPFRYRSAIYDTETALYYLGERYYNPDMMRFINADSDLEGDNEPLSHNLYAYCMNNPVGRVDEDGTWSLPNWAKIAIGTAVIAAAVVLTVATAGTGTALACFAVGALKCSIIGAASGAIGGAISGVIHNRITTGSWKGSAKAAADGAASGYMSGAITGFIAGGVSSSVCFVAGTRIAIENGYRKIEEIQVGDMVWAMDEYTGEKTLKRVLQTFERETNNLFRVVVGGQELITTLEHPFFVKGKGWMEAGKLKVGDGLMQIDNNVLTVDSVRYDESTVANTVYNFEVEDYHTYFVGDNNVWIHNACRKIDIKENGVKVKTYYPKDHGNPVHAHVKGGGPSTKIGPRGTVLKGYPALSVKQATVVNKYESVIKTTLRSIQRWIRRT